MIARDSVDGIAASGGEIVALGPATGSRIRDFCAACLAQRGRLPKVLSWGDFVTDAGRLEAMLHAGDYLRLDTPDRDIASQASLLGAGTSARDLEQGAIGSPAALSAGLVAGIRAASAIARRKGALVSCDADDVARAFDKTATLQALQAAGVPTARMLPGVTGWETLCGAMDAARMSRVFVKLRHGSSASGMIALARNGEQWLAITTAVVGGEGGLHATRRVRRLIDRRKIASLIDRLAPLGLHCEAWLPKIGISGRTVDVRVVVIGETLMPVLRMSRHPMTNLQLDSERGPAALLVRRIGEEAWQSALRSVQHAATCFPGLHTMGVDLAILADERRHAVLEVNAFGDHVKDVTVDGIHSHELQVKRIDWLLQQAVAPMSEAAA
jgi:hypothetical protein